MPPRTGSHVHNLGRRIRPIIVTLRERELLLFTQPDHAALAGALLALWRRDGLSEHPRRRELLLAAREHDNGWREADAAPRFDAGSGRPLDFRDLSIPDRIDIWRRGVRRFGNAQPLTALLILRHASEIHGTYRDHADWKEFAEELEALRRDLEGGSEIEPSAVERDYRFLELADALSLGACGALASGGSQETLGGYRFEVQLGRIGLEPFPLAGATTLEVAYRLLPSTAFDSAAAFSEELAFATWRRLPVHIEPIQDDS